MQTALNALEANNTRIITSLPPNKKAVRCTWVYKIKYKADGMLDRYKARLVAKGFTQTQRVDCFQTFSLVEKMSTVRIMLSLAVVQNWTLNQLDILMPFCMGICMRKSICIFHLVSLFLLIYWQEPCLQLIKSLYGLRQEPREWFTKFSQVVLAYGFTQSKADNSLFVFHTSKSFTALLVYVDDIILSGSYPSIIASVKICLQSHFKLKDLGHLHYSLGIEIARFKDGIYLHQRKYIMNLMKQAGLLVLNQVILLFLLSTTFILFLKQL